MTMCDGAGLGPRETGTSPGMVKVPEPEETEGLGASWEIMLILRSFISVHATQPAEGVCTTLQPAGMPPARAPAFRWCITRPTMSSTAQNRMPMTRLMSQRR